MDSTKLGWPLGGASPPADTRLTRVVDNYGAEIRFPFAECASRVSERDTHLFLVEPTHSTHFVVVHNLPV